jgi:GNAT superfamily N-acetyltransferase
MPDIDIRLLTNNDKLWMTRFLAEHWGSTTVAHHRGLFHPLNLPGFVAIYEGEKVGLITYLIEEDSCQIITINSTRPFTGIGVALIEAVHETARQHGCKRLWLITTNDNLYALHFYQKRGFVLVALHRNALEIARKLKPEIPLIGNDEIPLRDEIELEMILKDFSG